MTTMDFLILIFANIMMIALVVYFLDNRWTNLVDHIDWKYRNLIKYMDNKWELEQDALSMIRYVVEHENCRCGTVSINDKTYKYVPFFIRHCSDAYKIYVNVAGHIVITYEKEKFNYTTDLNDMFFEVFGRPIRLIQIYESNNQLHVVLDVGEI